MTRFTQLDVWQLARKLTSRVYRLTETFPAHELYGLSSQLRRAVISVMANVAEGSKKDSRTDFARYLNIAEASCAEAQSLVYAASDLGYLSTAHARELLEDLERTARMLYAFKKAVRTPTISNTSAAQ